MSKILTAEIATVQIGTLQVEGLMFPDGSFGVAIPQIVAINLIPPKRSLKQLKSMTGLEFQSHQKARTALHPKAVNAISILDFEKLLWSLHENGDTRAGDLLKSLVGLSLQQLFCDAFGVKFDVEDRQEWLIARMQAAALCRQLTDAIKAYYERHGKELKFYHYSNVMDCMNRALFGMTAKQIKEAERLTQGHLTRDNFGPMALMRIVTVQDVAAKHINSRDAKPIEAVKEVLDYLGYDVMSYRD